MSMTSFHLLNLFSLGSNMAVYAGCVLRLLGPQNQWSGSLSCVLLQEEVRSLGGMPSSIRPSVWSCQVARAAG